MRRAAPFAPAPIVAILAILAAAPAALAEIIDLEVPSPERFLGHKVGEDRKLAPWPKVVEYLRAVDAASDRDVDRDARASRRWATRCRSWC